eukprot:jgi/Botrbrau1/13748/Bobra.0056s0005.1
MTLHALLMEQEWAAKQREKLKAAQKDWKAEKARLSAAALEKEHRLSQDITRLQDQLATVQDALKGARSEAARRLGALQQLQAKAEADPSPAAAAAELATERAARHAAEASFQEAKAAAARKSAFVADLQKRVEELTRAVEAAERRGREREAEAAELRIKSPSGCVCPKG